jgi:hypothetical protein
MAAVDPPAPPQRPRLNVHPASAIAAAIFGAVLGICVADDGAAVLRTALLVLVVVILAVAAVRHMVH